MVLGHKKNFFRLGISVIIILSGFFLNQLYQKRMAQNIKNENLIKLTKVVEFKREELIEYSRKRSEVQLKFLNDYKLLNEPLKKIVIESDKIRFKNQKDFNDYEYYQNYIQGAITAKIKRVKNSDHINIKDLELSEKSLNEARLAFSENEIKLSKLHSRAPVTFLSDIQLLQLK